ncbi:MAG: 5'/3'-nucleotidase SurE [Clostridia bacterium]|nr:5'/3'-nucleotidase SurE [Clostridia bacterium]
MTILLTNDDGVSSEGINTLANALSKEHKIIVVAPNGNRSASSHSLTIFGDLIFKKEKISDKYESYSLSGTPADCVKFAMHYFNDIKFDLVLSGINAGDNLGSNTLYSGTLAAAVEGNYFDIPSIAFSCVSHRNCRFTEDAEMILKLFPSLLKIASPKVALNVNFPNIPREEIKGVRFAPLGRMGYDDYYQENENGSYSLKGEPIYEIEGESDVDLARKGYITLTPILFDRTDFNTMKEFPEIELL